MKTLNFYTVAERKPQHGELIFVLGSRHMFGTAYFDPKFLRVEYRWAAIDEDDGSEILYEAGNPTPEGYRLAILGGHHELDDQQMYAVSEDLQALEEPT
jgi:hypothetical protein